MNTEQLAERLGIKAQSIRSRYCRTGSYFGVVPDHFPNGRLDWPNDADQQLRGQCHDADKRAVDRSEKALATRRANASAKAASGIAAPAGQ
jgi:hypothetical protein